MLFLLAGRSITGFAVGMLLQAAQRLQLGFSRILFRVLLLSSFRSLIFLLSFGGRLFLGSCGSSLLLGGCGSGLLLGSRGSSLLLGGCGSSLLLGGCGSSRLSDGLFRAPVSGGHNKTFGCGFLRQCARQCLCRHGREQHKGRQHKREQSSGHTASLLLEKAWNSNFATILFS